MRRLLIRGIAVAVTVVFGTAVNRVQAEHAVIDLQVSGPRDHTQAIADQEPPPGGVNPRPLHTARSGDPLVLQFILTNVYPHGELDQVAVRYYVVHVARVGQETVPPLGEAVFQGQITMNFKPRCKAGARVRFKAPEPGTYLVRVDTQNTQSDHEHFSAIDLEVK